ncbi:MAG TPA: hypothetical protein DHW02_09715, partial [Ktedonobacter sp.]|nr:hypothetical protein [Ktedonobacter sp.]
LAAAGLGSWAVASKLQTSSTVKKTQKTTPKVNSGAPTFTLLAHTQPITSLAWSPTTPTVLVSAAKDSQVMLWDIAAFEQGQASQTTPKAKQVLGSTSTNSILLAWSADGQALAIGNAVFTVEPNGKLVDNNMLVLKKDLSGLVPYFNEQYMTFRRTGFIRTILWGPGKYLTAITFPAELASQEKYLMEFRDPLHPQQGFGTITQQGFGFSLAMPPDASKLAMGVFTGITVGEPMIAGHTASWKTTPTLLTFDGTKPLTNDGSKPPAGDVTWSPDGRYIAAITDPFFVPKYIQSQLAVWDAQQGDSSRNSLSLPDSSTILTRLAWSPAPTSTQLAAGSKDGSVYLWNVNPANPAGNALPVRTLTGPQQGAEVTTLAWSSDGRYLAAGYNDTNDSIQIWKV